MFKVNNKNNRMTFLVFLLLTFSKEMLGTYAIEH